MRDVMAIELILIKYSREGARGVVKEGFGFRRAAIQKVAAEYGERLLGFWATDDGEWDSVVILEATGDNNPAGSVAANLHGHASGTIERIRRLRLYTPEIADADLGVAADMQWAGQNAPSS
jgi:uncharacterized protein with GYD domain